MHVSLQIGEGTPLSWDRWRHIVALTERLGFRSLFRADHYYNGIQKDAIDVFLSYVAAGMESSRIRFGSLVTPVTFREPVNVGRMAQQLDALSGGRFVLGLGAGWFGEEHERFGLDFPPLTERYARLEEAIELMKVLWYSEDGHYDGTYYRLAGTDSKPHPPAGRPPILIGGTGQKRTLKIAAQHANHWNAVARTVDGYREALAALERHCEAIGRDPAEIERSVLIFTDLAPDEQTQAIALARFIDMTNPGKTVDELREMGRLPWQGTAEQLVDFLGQLAELGVQEVMFDHLCHEMDTIPEWIAAEIAPKLAAL